MRGLTVAVLDMYWLALTSYSCGQQLLETSLYQRQRIHIYVAKYTYPFTMHHGLSVDHIWCHALVKEFLNLVVVA